MDGEQRRGRQEPSAASGMGRELGTRARCLAVLGSQAVAICGARVLLEPLLDSVPAHTSTHHSSQWMSDRVPSPGTFRGAQRVRRTAAGRTAASSLVSAVIPRPRKISRDDQLPQGTLQGIVYSGGHREEYS